MAGIVLPGSIQNPTTAQIASVAWGDALNDAIAYLAGQKPNVRATRTTNQSLTTATYTSITLGNETFDVGGMHSTVTNTSRFTIPAGEGGKYLVGGVVNYDNNATGIRDARILLNGATVLSEVVISSPGFCNVPCPTDLYLLAAGDYIELQGFQSSGGSLNVVAAVFWACWQGTT